LKKKKNVVNPVKLKGKRGKKWGTPFPLGFVNTPLLQRGRGIVRCSPQRTARNLIMKKSRKLRKEKKGGEKCFSTRICWGRFERGQGG